VAFFVGEIPYIYIISIKRVHIAQTKLSF